MPRILLIEDEAPVRDVVELMLSMAGHEVTKTASAEEALGVLAGDAAFDLLMTDIFMPGMDGLDLLRQVRRLYPDMRVMAISGGGTSRNMDVLESARALGASPVLKKPFSAGELRKAIDQALQSSPAGDQE